MGRIAVSLIAGLLLSATNLGHAQMSDLQKPMYPLTPAETVLYSFLGGSDGFLPTSSLIVDAGGSLYGTTPNGGDSNNGTVFQLTPPTPGNSSWTETVLHRFEGGLDGSYPWGGVIFGPGGALYGATAYGGTFNIGTVFKLTPPKKGGTQWTNSVLYSFTGKADGGAPFAGLTIDASGSLYGVTAYGGTLNIGTVFKLTPAATEQVPWTESVLHTFSGADGAFPNAAPTLSSKGELFGTTPNGGAAFEGTVFELTPPAAGQTQWTDKVLYSFTGLADGGQPYAGVIVDESGALYGATLIGGTSNLGAAFKLTPPRKGQTLWTETVLHSFAGGADGARVLAGLTFGARGALFGTTGEGGPSNLGTVFKLTPPANGQSQWTETVLHGFTGNDGAEPGASVIFRTPRVLFGTTASGGLSKEGTVFELTSEKRCDHDLLATNVGAARKCK